MTSLVGHLRTVDDTVSAHAKTLCHALGRAGHQTARRSACRRGARPRLPPADRTSSSASAAAAGDAVEQLKNSPNPAVRRTAIHLLREFGGNDALGELARAPRRPRSERATRSRSARSSTSAPTSPSPCSSRRSSSGSAHSRDAITADRSSRFATSAPCRCSRTSSARREYRRRAADGLRRRAVDALGAIGGTDAVDALKHALHDGEWWAPAAHGRDPHRRRQRAPARSARRKPRVVLQEASTSGCARSSDRRHGSSCAREEGASVIDHNRRVQLADELLRRFAVGAAGRAALLGRASAGDAEHGGLRRVSRRSSSAQQRRLPLASSAASSLSATCPCPRRAGR